MTKRQAHEMDATTGSHGMSTKSIKLLAKSGLRARARATSAPGGTPRHAVWQSMPVVWQSTPVTINGRRALSHRDGTRRAIRC